MSSEGKRIPPPLWATRWLWAAGIYNLAWGTITILFPNLLFDLCGIPRVNYPEIWQCVGMIVGVYGIGYITAADDPRTHWPIVLVGLLGKIFGPIGFAMALAKGTFPPQFGLTILTNDLIWWIPFGMILWDAFFYRERPDPTILQHFVKESVIPASPEVVFRFHERPTALEQLIPPWEPMKVEESPGNIQVGSRVTLRGRIGPIPIQWVAMHTEYQPPVLFADRQEAGPFAWWYHRHHILPGPDGGTLLRDEIEYLPPLGKIGRLFGGWMIRRKLERMFDYRHETTNRLIQSGAWEQSNTHATSTTVPV